MGEQIEMKNNFINLFLSYRESSLIGFGKIYDLVQSDYDHQNFPIESKDKLFLDNCYEVSKSKRGQTPHSFFS